MQTLTKTGLKLKFYSAAALLVRLRELKIPHLDYEWSSLYDWLLEALHILTRKSAPRLTAQPLSKNVRLSFGGSSIFAGQMTLFVTR